MNIYLCTIRAALGGFAWRRRRHRRSDGCPDEVLSYFSGIDARLNSPFPPKS
jgi:hypothetical protein